MRELDELESKIAAIVSRSTADTHHLTLSRQKRSRNPSEELLARPENEDSPAKRACMAVTFSGYSNTSLYANHC